MGKIIAIINQKGGVGKTTTAINLSSYLAKLNKEVLLIDLDPQGNASSGLGFEQRKISSGLYELMLGGEEIKNVLKKTKQAKLSIIPATSNLAGAGVELVGLENREFRLASILKEIKDDYDYIIIDGPPSLGLLTVNALTSADEVLIPIQSEYYALEGLSQLLETINLVQEHLKPSLKIMGAVITMYDKRNNLSSAVMEELYRYFPQRIFRSVIPRSVSLAESPSFGLSILNYKPRAKSALAYENLAKEIINLENNY